MSIVKKIKNTNVDPLTICSVVLEQNVYYEIPLQNHLFWASTQGVRDKVTSGDLVVNDGTNDLNAADGLNWLEKFQADHDRAHSFHSSDDHSDFEGSPADGNMPYWDNSAQKWKPGDPSSLVEGQPRYAVVFSFPGSSDGVWLQLFRDTWSNNVGFVIPEPSKIKALSVSCYEHKDDDVEIQVFKNGVYWFSHTIDYPDRTSTESGLNYDLAVDDELSVYVPSKGGSQGYLEYPTFTLFIQVV